MIENSEEVLRLCSKDDIVKLKEMLDSNYSTIQTKPCLKPKYPHLTMCASS